MTKADIVNEITKKTGADKQAVLNTLEAFMDTVKESLSREENVYLRGFGSFIVKKRAQKTARNISKNTTIIIPDVSCLCSLLFHRYGSQWAYSGVVFLLRGYG